MILTFHHPDERSSHGCRGVSVLERLLYADCEATLQFQRNTESLTKRGYSIQVEDGSHEYRVA